MMRRSFISIVIAAWAATASSPVLAVPPLPVPDGEYAVGLVRAEFVDSSRQLDSADPTSGPRRIPAIVWYPTHGRGASGSSPYMSGDVAAVALPAIVRNFGYAVEELHAMTVLRMDVHPGAPAARHPRGFPVIVFSHGLFLYPEQNSVLASQLASHGYIVMSIAHPGDAADMRLEDGRVVATKFVNHGENPRLVEAVKTLVGGTELAIQPDLLRGYAEALAGTPADRSMAAWRDDTLAVAQAIVERNEPQALRDALTAADRNRLAFVGMSFGGANSARSCKLVKACRAAVNLDGQNFDPDLFGREVERPLLLMLSDWTRYSLFPGQPREADFSPNDLAYESWSAMGEIRDVVRMRVQGLSHVGFTDLVGLLEGPKREARVGEIDADEAFAAIGDLVLAFLDVHVRNGDTARIDRVVERHPALKRHVPVRLKQWVSEADR